MDVDQAAWRADAMEAVVGMLTSLEKERLKP